MGKGEETKAYIIHKSALLFNTLGYSKTSMSDIMSATGLKKGGIYRHFESKDDLTHQSFEYAISRVNRYYARALRGKRHAIDRLVAILHAFKGLQEDHPLPGGCPVMNTAIESDHAYPILKDRAKSAMEEWQQSISNIAQRGIERGQIKPESDPDTIATLILTTMEGALMLSRLYDDREHIERIANHMEKYIVENLSTGQ